MNPESSDIITSMPPSLTVIVLLIALVAAVFWVKRLLPEEYRWEVLFRDLLVGNLADRK